LSTRSSSFANPLRDYGLSLLFMSLATVALVTYVYRWSSARVAEDIVRYGPSYEAPTTYQIVPPPRRVASPKPQASNTLTDPNATAPDVVAFSEEDVPIEDDIDPERSDPTKYSPTGYRYGDPDPCREYVQPDFTTNHWLDRCSLLGIEPDRDPNSECQRLLYNGWAYGDTTVDPSFQKPEGCID
jgi:hypothetical protein